MLKEVEGRHFRVHTELLWKITENLSHFILLSKHVQLVQVDRSRVWILECGDRTHKSALASPIWTDKSEHVISDAQRNVLEGFDAVRVGLG